MLCKCGGWKYWDRSERLCSDCKVGSIRNEYYLDRCIEIKCPVGYGGEIIRDGRCPKGFGVDKIVDKRCPKGLGTWHYKSDPHPIYEGSGGWYEF